MGFQVGNFSLLATKSMHSVDSWLATIQANLNGSTRNAFKQSEITYGGNITYQLKNNRPEKAGEQIAEQVLTTGHTKVDWSQGSMVSSTQDTHFAIQGEGFFAVTSTVGIAGNPANFAQRTGSELTYGAGGNKVYLTRDGEFHFSIVPNVSPTDPVLVDKNGLAVLSDSVPTGTDNFYHFVMKSAFDSLPTGNGSGAFNRERPSVVQPSYDAVGFGAIATVTDVNELQYSSYGSTYFEAPTALSAKTIINGTDNVLDRTFPAGPASSSTLIESQLEVSNTKVEKNIVEMSVLGKVYNGFVQVIKMYNANIDEMLNFIR